MKLLAGRQENWVPDLPIAHCLLGPDHITLFLSISAPSFVNGGSWTTLEG